MEESKSTRDKVKTKKEVTPSPRKVVPSKKSFEAVSETKGRNDNNDEREIGWKSINT